MQFPALSREYESKEIDVSFLGLCSYAPFQGLLVKFSLGD